MCVDSMSQVSGGKQLCSYIHRVCMQRKLDGFDYCIRHILVDRSAPFRQCSYSHPLSSKRCPNAARKTERRDSSYCPWHIKRVYLKQKKNQIHQQLKSLDQSKLLRDSFAGLMKELEHYCPSDSHDKIRCNLDWVKQDDDNSVTASDHLRNKIAEAAIEMIAHESDDESNNTSLEDVLRSDIFDSDSENMDSDQDDSLRHAGVYTAEEVSLILRDKMLKLQSLYVWQFKYLQHLLRQKYKTYLQKMQKSKDAHHSLHQSLADNSNEWALQWCKQEIQKFNAISKYHRYHGQEALLKDKVREKRKAMIEGESYQPRSFIRCAFNKDEQCYNPILPLSQYCKTHILYDKNQILFRPCAAGDPPCFNPVISTRRNNTCLSHMDLKSNSPEMDRLMGLTKDTALESQDLAVSEYRPMNDIGGLELDQDPGSLFALDGFSDLNPT